MAGLSPSSCSGMSGGPRDKQAPPSGLPQLRAPPWCFAGLAAHSLRGEPTASCLLSCDSSGPQEGSPARAPTAQHLGLSEPAPERSSSPSAPSLLGVIPGVSSGLLPHTALLAVPAMSSCTPPCAMSYQGNGGIWRMHVQEGESQAIKVEGTGAGSDGMFWACPQGARPTRSSRAPLRPWERARWSMGEIPG